MSTKPVWDQFTMMSRTIAVSARQWVVGYGTLTPLGVIGCYRVVGRSRGAVRTAAGAAGGWLVTWFALLVVLLIGAQVQFTKICNGGPVVMCLLGGLGAATIWEWAGRFRESWRWPARISAAVALAMTFTTLPALNEMYRVLASGIGNPPTRFDPQIGELIEKSARPADGRPLRVLCDVQTGGLLPGIYGCQVFAGHWSLTPDFHRRAAMLYDVGLTPPAAEPESGAGSGFPAQRDTAAKSAESPASLEHFQILISHYGWDRVLIAKRSPAEAFAWGEPRLHMVAETSRWVIFACEPPAATPPSR
jgi:hypothetical protein